MRKEQFIILEGRAHGSYSYSDLLVSIDKYLFNKNSYEQHEALHEINSFMLHPRQFVDFLNLIRTGKAYDGNGKRISTERLDSILGEIINIRDPLRAENLDAYFDVKNRAMNIMYYKLNADGKFEKVREPLQDCLMKDKCINLQDYIKNANEQGFPNKNIKKGDLFYGYPILDAVARFNAYSDWAYLYCDRNPSDSYSSLGVRVAKIFHKE